VADNQLKLGLVRGHAAPGRILNVTAAAAQPSADLAGTSPAELVPQTLQLEPFLFGAAFMALGPDLGLVGLVT
jgi:hypothetical protein